MISIKEMIYCTSLVLKSMHVDEWSDCRSGWPLTTGISKRQSLDRLVCMVCTNEVTWLSMRDVVPH